ncbi:LysR family transcriptional regulator [Streptomyces gobiensis]|uniref:LysR family transcriptional regulator n=1 Tax=Streptomyces gobiensis TaxID=2875706 RepID=UPI001E4CC9D4|nr:LysR family transcriptional regulator [Streptomyces gobiensis]UGY92398.1 LysR family transcriptional regulator [Streptomyces gobiensis]
MDIRQLTTFQKAATLLSFSRAAAELNYAQSSVTGQIRGLENSLGVQLFERLSGRKVRLTPAGQRLLPYAERLLSLAGEARGVTAGLPEPSGQLVIGTMETLATYRMPPVLEYFHHRYPQLQLVLRPGSGAETLHALRQGTVDLGLIMSAENRHSGVESEVLSPEPLVAVVGPDHELATRTRVTAADLRSVPILAPESGRGYRRLLEAELRSGPGTPVPLLKSGTVESTKRWAASGLGIGLLPMVAVEEDTATGALAPLAWRPPFEVYTQLIRRRRTPLSREMQLFIDRVRAFMAQEHGAVAA